MLEGRTPRERWLIGTAAVLVVLWGLATLVWQPLLARRAALDAGILRAEQLLLRVERLPSATTDAPPADDRPLAVIATATAEDMGLGVARLQPQGAAVQVVLDDAPFDFVLLWIAALERDHGLRLTELSLSRRTAPGSVAATLTLER
ncbi:MAG: type II secretion system protein GspM [Gemmobacter sp.]